MEDMPLVARSATEGQFAVSDPPTTRRGLLAAGLSLGWPVGLTAAQQDRTIELSMRLAPTLAGARTVALTLDACPGGFDWRLARALAEQGTRATVFASGAWIRRNPEALAFLLSRRDLFAIENHGDRHIPPVLGQRRIFGLESAGTLDDVRLEVARGGAAVAQATGRRPRWYRAATGFYSPAAMPAIRALGYELAGYSLNADMGASLPARSVAARIAAARDGDVIVAHINQPGRSSGLGVARGVAALGRAGVRFVRLDELSASDVVT
jgi:peptidoglycan/xylan/chitin deacetylase (PgdA/CDA1 family)